MMLGCGVVGMIEWPANHPPRLQLAVKRCIYLLPLLLTEAIAQSADRVDYQRDVKPILLQKCFACHGALKQQAGLRLDTALQIRAGGESGPAISPGQPGESLLVRRVA